MTPKILYFGHKSIFVPLSEASTREEAAELIAVPGVNESAVLWNGHEFELGDAYIGNLTDDGWRIELQAQHDQPYPQESLMHLYYPLDPRTNAKLLEG